MNIRVEPTNLKGEVIIPPSKSFSHRAIICASLAKGKSIIKNIILSEDILATIEAVKSYGAKVNIQDNFIVIEGVDEIKVSNLIDAKESGSTLRFIIPILMLANNEFNIKGSESLIKRPLNVYEDIVNDLGGVFTKGINGVTVNASLVSKDYKVIGNISSQFISGLLFALPLLGGDSKIIIEGKLESKSYVLMTIDVLKKFGINVHLENNIISITGKQQYKPCNYEVEGDFSQMAFFAVGGILNGDVKCLGMNHNSLQGDKKILKIIKQMGANYETIKGGYIFKKSMTLGKEIDISQTPDLGPIIALLAASSVGVSKITGGSRLRIKESDRLQAIYETLTNLGVKVVIKDDVLYIDGVGSFLGGKVSSYNDHRITMMSTIASLNANSTIEIENANSVNKSYPKFFNDFENLGGVINET